MARYLRLNQTLYGSDGFVGVFRGDDWTLKGQVINRVKDVEYPADLSSASGASAFFPAASGGFMTGLVQVTDAVQGLVKVSVAAADSPNAGIGEGFAAPFLTVEDSQGLNTIVPLDSPLSIRDRSIQPL